METRFTKLLRGLTRFCLYSSVFLIPLFFLPFTAEKLEMNKYFLLYFLTALALLCWLGWSLLKKTFEIRRTPLDIPLLVFWLFFLIAAILSQDRYQSFFGDFNFLGVSFLGLTAFLLFYFLVVQTINKLQQILGITYLLLLSGAITAAYFILFNLKLFAWPNFLPQFNVASSSNAIFGIFLAIIFALSLGLLTIKKNKIATDIIFAAPAIISLAALVMLGFKLAWIVTAIAIFLILVLFLSYADKIRTFWTSVAFTVFVIALIFLFLGVPHFLTAQLPVEVSLSPSVSLQITLNTITTNAKNFLFGTGPGTFMFDFSKYRPTDFNNNQLWNIRFQQSHDSVLDWVAATGVLGALSFLLLILTALGLMLSTWLKHLVGLKNKRKTMETKDVEATDVFERSPLIFWTIVGSWLTLLISLFLTNFGMAQWFLFWLLLGLIVNASAILVKVELPIQRISLKTTPEYALATSFGFILIFTVIIVTGIYLGRYMAAEIVYARTAGQTLDQRISALNKITGWNPHRILFHLALADAFLNKAVEVADSTKDANQVTALVASAVQSARNATDQSPNNVASWEHLADMYANAQPIAPEANDWAIDSLEKAIALEPTNPTLYVAIGDAKMIKKNYAEAQKNFETAVSLKQNFLLGYLRLALLRETDNDLTGSIAALEKGFSFGGLQDPVYVFQVGRYYFNRAQKGDYDMAETAFRRAIALQPNYADAIFALALLYDKTGEKKEALTLYKEVLQFSPNSAEVKTRINQLLNSNEESGTETNNP
ncbi:MAG: tetratricopeptide repeat protein [Candidatus Magasanikbacteria bacterium]|nr:tetratricopeptide repeat protein [Candidatus Magasanikbacteria bacterium]